MLEEEEELTVATLVLPKKGRGEEIYEKLEVLAKKRGGDVVYLETGDVITAGKLTLSCIYAGEGVTSTDRNSQSLVLCADYGDFHMLFTGDMGTEEERALLSEAEKTEGAYQRGHLSHVNILKIAHHGSSGSSCLEFLERMPLRAAVVSYGKGNSYGHPSKEVMERLRTLGVPVWEIGTDGAWTKKNSASCILQEK
jgi:competence protein ComEC